MQNNCFKFGVHFAGVGGIATGYSDYLRQMADAGKSAIVQSVDNAGPVFEAQTYNKPNDVLVFRMTNRDGITLDTANYTADPVVYANQRWEMIKYFWPTELNPRKVWTVCLNEPSKELSEENWLAEFTLECGKLAIRDKRRHLALGWSMGTPEQSFWEHQSMIEYLMLCEQYPEYLGVSLHEYSGDDDITDNCPYFIGRFQFLHDICDDYNIAHPTIVIGEFGWREAAIKPYPGTFREQLNWAQSIYGSHPNILGAMIWTLGNWHGTVASDLVDNLPALIDMAKNYQCTEPPPVEPPPQTGRKVTVLLTPQFSTLTDSEKAKCYDYQEHGFPIGDTRTSGEHTLTPSHDDAFDLYVAGIDGSNLGVVYPQKSGYTYKWIQSNRPDVLDANKNIMFLEESKPNPIPNLNYGDVVVDISNAQGKFDMSAISDKVKRFIIRVSSGKRYSSTDENGIDKQFWNNAVSAIALNKPVEAYMFLNNEEPFVEQVDRFYSELNKAIESGLSVAAVAIDCEGLYSPQTERDLRDAITLFKNKNTVCDVTVVYSGAWWWNTKVPATATWPNDLGLEQWAAYYVGGTPIKAFPSVSTKFPKLNGFKKTRYWQFASSGGLLVNHSSVSLDLNYYLGEIDVPPIEPPPPVGELVDMTNYFKSPAPVGYWMVFSKLDGTIDHQNQEQNGITYRLKGNPSYAEYEEIKVEGDYVWRRYDTSPGNGQYYRLNDLDNPEWSKWCPRQWRVGDYYLRNPRVKWFLKSNCTMVKDDGYVQSYLYFAKKHDTWMGGVDGVPFNNVIELQWKFSKSGDWIERYFLCERYGYVGWQANGGAYHYCIDIPLGRQPMIKEIIGCM